MRFCYGEQNHLRILEEAEFWKRQEAEHTVVIREIVANLEEEYVEQLKECQQAFNTMENTIVQLIERLIRSHCPINPELVGQIVHLIQTSVQQSQMFVSLLNTIIGESAAVRDNMTALVVINHIIRESEYYMGIAEAYLSDVACRRQPPL